MKHLFQSLKDSQNDDYSLTKYNFYYTYSIPLEILLEIKVRHPHTYFTNIYNEK